MKLKGILLSYTRLPYPAPPFNRLSWNANSKLKVVALAENEANREWRIDRERAIFSYHILPGRHDSIWHWELPAHLNRGVMRALKRDEADIIITSGCDSVAYWGAFPRARILKKPFILCNTSTLHEILTVINYWAFFGIDHSPYTLLKHNTGHMG